MDSLTKILEKIKQDNKLACDEILQDANKKAEEIISNAEKNALQTKSDILKKGEKHTELFSFIQLIFYFQYGKII